MNTAAWQQRLDEFARARDWRPFLTPKNLAMAMSVEAAEVVELFQWLTPEQSQQLCTDAPSKTRVADELADVMLYLLQLAAVTGVDLDQALEAKFAKNALKYPAPPAQPA